MSIATLLLIELLTICYVRHRTHQYFMVTKSTADDFATLFSSNSQSKYIFFQLYMCINVFVIAAQQTVRIGVQSGLGRTRGSPRPAWPGSRS